MEIQTDRISGGGAWCLCGRGILLLLCCAMLAFGGSGKKTGKGTKSVSKQPAKQENLLKNGGFDKGEGRNADKWGGTDGLTAKWETSGGNPGACVVFDTSVLQEDKKTWKTDEEVYNKKGPSKGGKYDTVGAHEGVWVFSWPVDVTEEDSYWVLSADVYAESDAMTKVFVRGYNLVTEKEAGENSSFFHVPHPGGPAYSEQFGPMDTYRASRAGDYLMIYRHTLVCRVNAKEWTHCEMGFKLPSGKMKSFRPQRVLIKPYAYWPNGIYKYDNIVLRRSTAEEVKQINMNRPSVNEK